MIKIYNDRKVILNGVVISSYIIDNTETLIKHHQNDMIYLKLEGTEENFKELNKLIEHAKRS